LDDDVQGGGVERQPPRLDVQGSVSAGRHTFVLTGELDIGSARGLEETIRQVCGTGTKGIKVDLRNLAFIDSSGLSALINAGRLCEKHGHEFLLVPGPANIQRIFEISGLIEALPFTA
jgi:anti-sigma B factor antagonist